LSVTALHNIQTFGQIVKSINHEMNSPTSAILQIRTTYSWNTEGQSLTPLGWDYKDIGNMLREALAKPEGSVSK
jgi:hypothetical protein